MSDLTLVGLASPERLPTRRLKGLTRPENATMATWIDEAEMVADPRFTTVVECRGAAEVVARADTLGGGE